jgi:hypothetical protein
MTKTSYEKLDGQEEMPLKPAMTADDGLVWKQSDAPPTTCDGTDYYNHTAIAAHGTYSIDVGTYPDTGEVSGHSVRFSDGDGWRILGERLGLAEAMALAQSDHDQRIKAKAEPA